MKSWSNIALLLATVVILFLSTLSASEARYLKKPTFKQARAIRGFKSMPLQVGRGFGKRASDQDFLVDLEDNVLNGDVDELSESFPVEWLAEKMENNPAFARTVLRKFVDINGDGQLTLDELLRPVY
uniref:Allatotropin n=1 Tax=Carabus violaceus TaxID=41075 RepID=A0A7U3MC46_CARVO|nr:allatotropin [Carabus violaceus]